MGGGRSGQPRGNTCGQWTKRVGSQKYDTQTKRAVGACRIMSLCPDMATYHRRR